LLDQEWRNLGYSACVGEIIVNMRCMDLFLGPLLMKKLCSGSRWVVMRLNNKELRGSLIRSSKWIVVFLILLTTAITFAAQEEPKGKSAGQEAHQYVIEPDDILQVTIFASGEAQKELELLVDANGYVTFPFIGNLKAGGMTLNQLSKYVTKKLKGDYFIDPQVLIKFKAISKVFVLGYVVKPGAFEYNEGMTALEACTLAGGFAKYAAPNRTIISRHLPDGKTEKFEINLEAVREGDAQDVPVRPGDRIFVPRSWF
jgi:protein involved in polysaccharide export with SLBB domain